MEAADLLSSGFDFYWQPPPRFFFEPYEQEDLAIVDSTLYVPTEAAESMSGLYSYCEGSTSSPDGASSYSTPAVPAASPPPTAVTAGADAASKNIAMERDRRRRLNEKLYALRSVVPNITKMDRASIIRDAIAYIEQLQEQERRMLADIADLESASAAVKTEEAATTGWACTETEYDTDDLPSGKKMRWSPDDDAVTRAASSPPVQIIEVQMSEVGEKVAVVSLRCSRGRDAVAKVCRALEPLRLRVVTASIAAAGDTVVHTMFVEIEEMGGAQLKETILAALAQVDVTRSSLKSMSYWED